jgi:hypothetical protein
MAYSSVDADLAHHAVSIDPQSDGSLVDRQ